MPTNRLPNFLTTQRGICVTQRTLSEDFPEHAHDYFEIEYVLSGKGTLFLNDTPYPFESGTLSFFTPVDFQAIKVESDITLLNISFTESWVDADIAFQLISPAVISGYNFPMYERFVEEYNSENKYNDIVVKGILNTVLCDITRNIKKEKSENHKKLPVAIRRSLLYIHQNFTRDISLQAVSKNSFLHPVYFSKLFCDTMDMTFSQYLSGIRLEYAKRLLVNSDFTVTQICYMSGFSSLSHFLRCFKASYGATPKSYRTQNKEKRASFEKPEDYYF